MYHQSTLPLPDDESRYCEICGVPLHRDKTLSPARWAKRRFCGRACSGIGLSLTCEQKRSNPLRLCRGCDQHLPVERFDIFRNSDGQERRRARCHVCLSNYQRAAYWKNPEKARAYQSAWARRHPEVTRRRHLRWAERNREYLNRYWKEYRERNRQVLRERDRARRAALGREEMRRRWRRWGRSQSERGYHAAYRARNRKRISMYQSEWRANNSGRLTETQRRRYKRMIESTRVDKVSRTDLIQAHGSGCYLCDDPLSRATLTMDHVIPLARGGEHTLNNLRPCCGRCNSRKGARLWPELETQYPEMARRIRSLVID